MLIKDIFKYFAAFVPVDVLRRTFQLSSGADYNAFKTEVLQEESDHRLQGITDFIFGIDADMIRQRITSVHGPYLFVEYSRVTSTIHRKVTTASMWPYRWPFPSPTTTTWWGARWTRTRPSPSYPPYGATCGMTMTPSVA